MCHILASGEAVNGLQRHVVAAVGAVVRVSYDGKPYGEYPLVTLEPVAVAGLFRRSWDTLRLWLK